MTQNSRTLINLIELFIEMSELAEAREKPQWPTHDWF